MTCTGWRASAWRLEELWMDLLDEHHPSADPVLFTPWFADGDCTRPLKTAKKMRAVIETFGEEETAKALTEILTKWAKVRERFSRAPAQPDVGYFAAIAPFYVRHNYTSEDFDRLTSELKEFERTNPFRSPPGALLDRLRLVKAAVCFPLPNPRRSHSWETAKASESSVIPSGWD